MDTKNLGLHQFIRWLMSLVLMARPLKFQLAHTLAMFLLMAASVRFALTMLLILARLP